MRASPFRGPKRVSYVVALISKPGQGRSLLRTIRQQGERGLNSKVHSFPSGLPPSDRPHTSITK